MMGRRRGRFPATAADQQRSSEDERIGMSGHLGVGVGHLDSFKGSEGPVSSRLIKKRERLRLNKSEQRRFILEKVGPDMETGVSRFDWSWATGFGPNSI